MNQSCSEVEKKIPVRSWPPVEHQVVNRWSISSCEVVSVWLLRYNGKVGSTRNVKVRGVKLVVGLLILLTILCCEVVTMTRTNAKCHFCSKARKAEVSGADDFLQFALVFPGQV